MEIYLSSFTILLSLFLFLFMLSKHSKKNIPSSNTNILPPGPRKFPFIGNLHLLTVSDPSRLPHHILRDLSTKHGPVMHLQLGEIPTVVISSAEAAEEVMRKNDVVFASRPSLLATEIIFYGGTDVGFSPYGAYWRQMRKIATLELLSAKRVQSFRHIREVELLNLCRWIASNDGSIINLTQRISASNYDIIARSSIGEKTEEQKLFVSVVKEAMDVLGGFYIADLYPSIKFLRVITGLKARIERIHKGLDGILESIIRQRKRSVSKVGKDREEDLLDVLLKLKDDANLELPLTIDNIKALMLDVFIAGSDTSSTTPNWAMSEMLKNSRILNKAQDEVRRVFDGKAGYIDESHLDELKYLKLVIKETLRLHPPGPFLLPRESRESCEVLGYEIPAKTRVMINAWAISRDSKYWEDPERFIPERFLDSSIDYKGNDFHYTPFGAGRRICPGIAYGLANVEMQLASFLHYFDWSLPGGMNPEEMDMTEAFGLAVRRKSELYLIPTVARPLPDGLMQQEAQ